MATGVNGSRKEFLAGLAGTAVVTGAGCLGLGETVRSPPLQVSVSDLPRDLAEYLTYEVEVLEGFTADHPARIEVSATLEATDGNSSGTPATVGFGETPPYSFYLGGKPDLGEEVAILPKDPTHVEAMGAREVSDWIPDEPTDGCWKAPTWPKQRIAPDDTTTVELEPGETLSTEYVVLSLGGHCLSDGEYVFTSAEPYHVERAGDVLWENEEEWIVTLRMTIGEN